MYYVGRADTNQISDSSNPLFHFLCRILYIKEFLIYDVPQLYFENMLNSFRIMKNSENDYVFFILRWLTIFKKNVLWAINIIIAFFTPSNFHRTWLLKGIFSFRQFFFQELIKKLFCDGAFLWKYFRLFSFATTQKSENYDIRNWDSFEKKRI
jgi:hypothetical protein